MYNKKSEAYGKFIRREVCRIAKKVYFCTARTMLTGNLVQTLKYFLVL